jgi:hypothetical protein
MINVKGIDTPEVNDPVEDYVYGLGLKYTGKITDVSKGIVTVSLECKVSWFQKLITGEPPSMEDRKIGLYSFSSLDWDGECWQLDTFL